MKHGTAWLSFTMLLPAFVGGAWLVVRPVESSAQHPVSDRTKPALVDPGDGMQAYAPTAVAKAFRVPDAPPVAVPAAAPAPPLIPAAGSTRVVAPSPVEDWRFVDIEPAQGRDQPADANDEAGQVTNMAEMTTYTPRLSPEAATDRDRSVSELAASGSDGSQWFERIRKVENDWLAIDNGAGFGIEFDDWVCYKSGCTVTLRSPSREMLNQFFELAGEPAGMQNWGGGGRRSDFIQSESGEVEVTFIFEAPSG